VSECICVCVGGVANCVRVCVRAWERASSYLDLCICVSAGVNDQGPDDQGPDQGMIECRYHHAFNAPRNLFVCCLPDPLPPSTSHTSRAMCKAVLSIQIFSAFVPSCRKPKK